jgi:hypothetical protein
MRTKRPKKPDNQRAKRTALSALKRARRAAEQSGVELSDWEGEFLGSVEGRVEKYGRAFADPDLGAINGALSLRQGVKLKEITAKAKGKPRKSGFKKPSAKSGFRRRGTFGKPRSRPHGG